MNQKLTTTLFIPTINEIDGLKAIMPTISKDWVDQIMISDGGSTDGTIEYAKEQGYDVVIQSGKGIRNAYFDAYPKITGDIVVSFSPDGNCDPKAIPILIEKIKEGHDLAMASRYKDHARSFDDDFLTSIGNWFFTGLIRWLFSYPYTDALNIYRAYRTKLFFELALDEEESYKLDKLFGTVCGIEPLLCMRAAKKKLNIVEIPWDEPARKYGRRKLKIFRTGGFYLFHIFLEYFSKKHLQLDCSPSFTSIKKNTTNQQ
jgi:glycosyltransferase involved in cell wall biosynthesis